MRKRCNRKRVVALPPRGLRPMVPADIKRDLSIVHLENLDIIAKGAADESTLWDIVGGVLTWSCVANRLELGMLEMDAQLGLTTRLVDHYRETGRIEFQADDYNLARAGTIVMDHLAELVDHPTAKIAAEWSERRVAQMVEACHG